MRVNYLAALAAASLLSVTVANSSYSSTNAQRVKSSEPIAQSKLKVCAGKNPCAGKTANSEVFTENGIAVRGTDVVAYFTQSQAVKGSDRYTYKWKGATWKFSSAANRDLFASNPTQYAPQYGGYCALAVSEGNLAPTDPEAWKIVDGKLYLNYDKTVQAEWLKDIPGNIAKANLNWPGVLAKK